MLSPFCPPALGCGINILIISVCRGKWITQHHVPAPCLCLPPHLFHIPQALSVLKDQAVVWLGGVGHTPHPDALGFRLHCGAQRETCKGRGESNIQSQQII